MANIGGNIDAMFQAKIVQKTADGKIVKNEIGEVVHSWVDRVTVKGWLGLQSGDSKYSIFGAKIEESSHVFLCDYDNDLYMLSFPNESGVTLDVRVILKNVVYDVLLIDNPDEMNEQLEIYLRKVGAWNG